MKAKLVSERIDFERGVDPRQKMGVGKYAELEEILNDPDELRDYLVNVDNALHTATEIYLPNEKAKELARMWWEDSNGIKNWEFKSIVLHAEDMEEDSDYDEMDDEINKLIKNGWKLFHKEDNIDIVESILYKRSNVNESYNFERGRDPKHSMGLGMRDELVDEFRETLSEKWPAVDEEEIFKDKGSYIEIDLWPLSTYGMNSLDRAVKKILRKHPFKGKLFYVNDNNYEELGMEEVYDEEAIYIKIL